MDSFSVVGGPLDTTNLTWTVLSATGEEALSSLFSFTLTLAAKREEVDTALATAPSQVLELALLGQRVRFQLGDSGFERFGIVAAAHAEPTVQKGGEPYARVRIHVAPRAWLLTQRRLTRIFQGKYVHEIVSEVLSKGGVRHRWNLGNVYPKRLYCTQYDETDYEFVARLLAEEGILFFFEHAQKPAESPSAGGSSEEESGWDTAKKVMDGIAKGAGIASKVAFKEYMKFAGAAAAVAADFMKPPPKDD